ncbi:helix-turn-helix transcriptional regulator [Paenibacillus radicis (ex Gao et al. 2016)]|uniref:Transcriptional regulator n=1 Tax=Paenibacillus radicis (ex Gao et al. 2016) TaxID=1737354 RepID=A0A917H544_9BACL|nr:YafY family protein [Paenibacillus radicis (ex Gao et al. 2016)]GGG67944.1 transcriptional regulator [Paenibacillus radicis (ex Gao et al. 2016)]
MKSDRLLSILLQLQNYGKLTTGQLAEKLEVTKRTIIRDMDALSAAGVPVYAERGPQGGWTLSPQYRTQLTGMKAEELAALFFSSQGGLLQDLGMHKHYELAFEKLLAASPDSIRLNAQTVRQKIHIDGAGWHQSIETFPLLPAIQEAVWEERKLLITYNKDTETVSRTIDPLGLVSKQSIWYVVAASEDIVKSYRISRLLTADKLDEHFSAPDNFELDRFWEQSTMRFIRELPRYHATIEIAETAFDAFKQRRYLQVISHSPPHKGIISAEVQFNTLESACQIMLSFGPHVTAVAPHELRSKLIETIEAMRVAYTLR